jgi:hypothetical protein
MTHPQISHSRSLSEQTSNLFHILVAAAFGGVTLAAVLHVALGLA